MTTNDFVLLDFPKGLERTGKGRASDTLRLHGDVFSSNRLLSRQWRAFAEHLRRERTEVIRL